MAEDYLSNFEAELACPKCGKKTKKKIGWLKKNPSFACPGCGGIIEVDSGNLTAEIRKANKAIDDLRKKLI